MQTTAPSSGTLDDEARASALAVIKAQKLDVLVVGGGATGAGAALDAASRGLKVGLIEADDWGSGTSSESSKLLHGGLRYLEMLDFPLVHEAILERNLLLRTVCPHLAVPVPFVYPVEHPVIERAFVEAGLSLYDGFSFLGGSPAVPLHRGLGTAALHREVPDIDTLRFRAGARYYDARIDDARLVITLVRTAAHFGAQVVSRARATGYLRDEFGHVQGITGVDVLTGQSFEARAKHTILTSGVWTERVETLSGVSGGLRVLASKGVHIVVPRSRLRSHAGIIAKTERSVLFVIPWKDNWIIGTTDTPWHGDLGAAVATRRDIDYILGHANRLFRTQLTRADVIASYAGLRPLLQPGARAGTASTQVSREHTVASPAKGLTVVAGGKLTTYRLMAEDAINFALGKKRAAKHPSHTDHIPLLGARGFGALVTKRGRISRVQNWDTTRMTRLMNRYGTLLYQLMELIGSDQELAEPLHDAPTYLGAEIAYGCRYEGAETLVDLLERRTRICIEYPDRGLPAAVQVAQIAARYLGWTTSRQQREVAGYAARCRAFAAAAAADDDVQAAAAYSKAQS